MFCDIRSFTTIAEAQGPAETIELLNDYYTLMMDAISQGGVVNQIIGDGLMAIFARRCRQFPPAGGAGRPADDRLIEFFNYDQASSAGQISIGIGIASTGDRAAGTQHRATHTCVGDNGQPARGSSRTKEIGRSIRSENTREGLEARSSQPEGELMLKGKANPVNVYSVA